MSREVQRLWFCCDILRYSAVFHVLTACINAAISRIIVAESYTPRHIEPLCKRTASAICQVNVKQLGLVL